METGEIGHNADRMLVGEHAEAQETPAASIDSGTINENTRLITKPLPFYSVVLFSRSIQSFYSVDLFRFVTVITVRCEARLMKRAINQPSNGRLGTN